MMDHFKPAFNKALATFVAGATAAPLTAAMFDLEFFTAVMIAGVIAVWNLAGRWAEAEIKSHQGGE